MIQQISSLMLIAALVFSAGTSSMGKEIKESAQTVFEQPYLAIAPVQTHPGDAVLVKSKQATSVTLFQKTYRLQPSNGEYVRLFRFLLAQSPGPILYKLRITSITLN